MHVILYKEDFMYTYHQAHLHTFHVKLSFVTYKYQHNNLAQYTTDFKIYYSIAYVLKYWCILSSTYVMYIWCT